MEELSVPVLSGEPEPDVALAVIRVRVLPIEGQLPAALFFLQEEFLMNLLHQTVDRNKYILPS